LALQGVRSLLVKTPVPDLRTRGMRLICGGSAPPKDLMQW
jgi:hypothetical protein